jgi:glycosidase
MILALAALQTVEKTFSYYADVPAKSVSLAGTFNNWDKNAQPMTLSQDGRTWSTSVKLPYGRVQYKFVIDGDRWIVDPKGKTINDGNGNLNSELTVLPPDYSGPAQPIDGVVAASALRHRPGLPDVNVDRGRILVRVRTRANDVAGVSVAPEGASPVPMSRISRDELYDTYEARLPVHRIRYAFLFQDKAGAAGRTYGPDGLDGKGKFEFDPAKAPLFRVPAWPEGSVVYQIFPDRFANGDKSNDLPGTLPWDATNLSYGSRLGGDVAGVRKHLPYLQSLGVKTLYYTPVFDSPSYHRYDARSYTKIAPDFGTNADFARLTQESRALGMRTVMDFAFNHTATDGPWFMDLRRNGENSKYRDFYFPKSFPIEVKNPPNYVAWYGYPQMPKLNSGNPVVQKQLIASVDYWRTNASLAGVRLDVGNEVDPSMWRLLRRHTKATSPDFWIVGENWGDGTPWFGGDQWDSQMGYQFREAALAFFPDAKTKPSEFLNRLMGIYSMYPPQVSRNLMNLIGSHDTPRFLTLCKGDGDLHRLATTVLLTWPGSPMIYYGDELGMTGGADPMNRKGMAWPLAGGENKMLRFYRRMIAVRNANPVLQSGEPVVLMTDDARNCLAFSRVLENRKSKIENPEAAIVAVNRGDAPQTISVPVPAALRGKTLLDALSGRRYAASATTLAIPVGPKKAVVIVRAIGPNLAFKTPY